MRWFRAPGALVLIFFFLSLASGAAVPRRTDELRSPGAIAPGYGGVVFTQLPADNGKPASYEGARIVLLRPNGSVRVLTEQFHSAADPEVSFDGKRILFAGKREASDRWQIFEMQADGSGLRQVTEESADCRNPVYQSAFFAGYADAPWYQITYVRQEADVPSALYSCRLDGTSIRRLTVNPYADMDPFLMPDGRILYAGWQRDRLEPGFKTRLGLFGINLDGTDYAVFSADEGGPMKRRPCVTTNRLAVFVEPGNPGWDGEGTLAAVSLRRNLHSYRKLTLPAEGLYHSPSALPNGEILVARRPSAKVTHGIWRFDPATKRTLLVYDDPRRHDLQPRLLAARQEPDGRASVVDDKEPTGRLYCLNVYTTDLPNREWMPNGTVKRLRVIEGVPPRLDTRFLGEVNVEEDGSFNLQLPANIPLRIQTLDSDGLALRTSAWIWVKNKEARGCIGCHEDGERTPDNRLAKALLQPSIPLTLPPQRRRTVDYSRDVTPVLAEKCGGQACHGGGAAPKLADPKVLAKYVRPGAARMSPLMWSVFGRNTSRPWDRVAAPARIRRMPPAGSPPLTEQERLTLIEWIDLGARTGEPATHVRSSAAPKGESGGRQ